MLAKLSELSVIQIVCCSSVHYRFVTIYIYIMFKQNLSFFSLRQGLAMLPSVFGFIIQDFKGEKKICPGV